MSDRTPVQLFVTCLVDAFFPAVGRATVALLEQAGFDVEFPFDQTCCGQPAFNAGFRSDAERMARQTLDVLDGTTGPIVVPSGSCASMLIEHTQELVARDPLYAAKASRVAARTRELTTFLVDDVGLTEIGRPQPGVVAYHPSCHGLRGLGIRRQPEVLIDGAPGVDRVAVSGAEECCGFGGLFSVEMPDISAAMLDSKLDRLEASGAETVVGGDISCLMHIEGGLRRRGSSIETRHIAEFLTGEGS